MYPYLSRGPCSSLRGCSRSDSWRTTYSDNTNNHTDRDTHASVNELITRRVRSGARPLHQIKPPEPSFPLKPPSRDLSLSVSVSVCVLCFDYLYTSAESPYSAAAIAKKASFATSTQAHTSRHN